MSLTISTTRTPHNGKHNGAEKAESDRVINGYTLIKSRSERPTSGNTPHTRKNHQKNTPPGAGIPNGKNKYIRSLTQ